MIAALVADTHPEAPFSPQRPVLGRPLATYPLICLQTARSVKRTYVMTEIPEIKTVTLQYQPVFLDPPPCAPQGNIAALLNHGWPLILKDLEGEEPLEFLAVLLMRSPFATGQMLDDSAELLRSRPDAEAAVTVSSHPSLHPLLARRETARGLLEPRDPTVAAGEVWYLDGGLALLRRGLLDNAGTDGTSLFDKALPIKQQGGAPVLDDWQVPGAEFWLRRHGVPDLSESLQPQPKPQLQGAPKGGGDRR